MKVMTNGSHPIPATVQVPQLPRQTEEKAEADSKSEDE